MRVIPWSTVRVIAAGLLGALSIAAYGLSAPVGVALVAVAGSILVGIALSDPFSPRGNLTLRAMGSTLILLGMVAFAFHTVKAHSGVAIAALALGTVLAVLSGGVRIAPRKDMQLMILGTFFVFGVITLASWLHSQRPDSREASHAVTAATTVLTLVVVTLLNVRYGAFMEQQQRKRESKPLDAIDPSTTPVEARDVWTLLVALAVSALAALGALFAVAAPTLGVDAKAGRVPANLAVITVAGGVAAVLCVLAVARGELGRTDIKVFVPDAPVELRVATTTLLLAGNAIFLIAVGSAFRAPLHYPAVVAFVALYMGVLATEHMLNAAVYLQLTTPSRSVFTLSVVSGATVATSLFWLLSVGLWDLRLPASGLGGVEAVGAALVPTAILVAAAGTASARAVRTMYITEQPGWFDAMVEPFLYAMAALMTAAIPLFVIGRFELTRPANAGLAATALLSFLPAFFAVFWRSLRNNAKYARFESTIVAAPIQDSIGRTQRAGRLNRERVRRLHQHVQFSNRAFYILLCLSAIWTAVHIAAIHPRRPSTHVPRPRATVSVATQRERLRHAAKPDTSAHRGRQPSR